MCSFLNYLLEKWSLRSNYETHVSNLKKTTLMVPLHQQEKYSLVFLGVCESNTLNI